MVFGPRLDRPSAIGDEGRPRATGLTIAALVVVCLFAAAGFVGGPIGFLPAVGLAVGVTMAGAAMLDRDRLGVLLLAHLGFLPFASALLGLVVLSFLLTPYGVMVVGFAVSMLGIAGSWTDVLSGERVESVATQSLLAYGSMLAGAVVFAFVGGVGWLLWTVIVGFVGGVGPSASVVGFVPLCCALATALRIALSALPVVQLTPVSRRPVVADRVDGWKRAATVVAVACFLLTGVVAVCWAAGVLDALYTLAPGIVPLLAVLSSPFVAGPVVVVAVGALLLSVAAWLARWLTRDPDPKSMHRVAAVMGGGLLVVAIVPLVATGLSMGGILGVLLGIVFALVGPPFVLTAMGAGLVMAKLGVLPVRASGPALAGTGLVVATIGAGIGGLPGPVVFACAAGALVVWDVSSFALGVTAELGHVPETRRLELFHGVIGVGLAVVAVAATSGIDVLRSGLASADGTVSAGVAAAIGVLLLLALLRG